ncbi:MAG TPA: MarR family transcriptional regulator [Clostridium sp.]|jgi:DNA-binding MarR family transcriptional regulator|uniref:MarR family winged helix-turn-helix transcriptional regulator n=1 Tax=Clostridium lapidicellarium TaxID=3240931 RepID=A0ABV4DYM0_9CLOT|nr:MarR family transcriptional regulator [uncultured Clostridium sp.]NLU08201.1 MarR family transcriptional regulator [Clostridiales bacterium]HBC98034.1 MarR family transcriptional regulator [Clostridium sp.]
MEINECINFLLSRAQRNVFQCLKSELSEFNVTPAQYGVLKCLWGKESQTPKQIADVLGLDGSTITGILDRMEVKDLIRRAGNPQDRRTLKVIVTEKGSKLQKSTEKIVDRVNNYMLEIFTDDEQKQLKKFLKLIAKR